MAQERRLYDGLFPFPKGINSDKNPLLLSKDQLSFALNATNRGDLVSQRPCFNDLVLNFIGSATGAAFQSGLWQSWSYFAPAPSLQYLMVVVSGQLFQIALAGNVGTVTIVTLPDVGNSMTTPIQWMWQAERWLIWNDGINLPMIYDGNTARRSLGDSEPALATTAESFTAPNTNQPVAGDVQLNGPYTGPIGIDVLINSATYYVKGAYSLLNGGGSQAPGYASASMSGITGKYTNGDTINPGASLSLNNQIQGCILSAVDGNSNPITVWPAAPLPPAQITVTVALPNAFSPTVIGQRWVGGSACPVNTPRSGGTIAALVGPSPSSTILLNVDAGYPAWTTAGQNGFLTSADGCWTVSSWGAGAFPLATYNYFTLALTQSFTGNTGDTLNVGGALMTVVGYNGTSVVCQMQGNAYQGQNIPFIASANTLPISTEIVYDTTASGSLTVVATYPLTNGAVPPVANGNYTIAQPMVFPNAGVVASGIIPDHTYPAQPYMIVQLTNPGSGGGSGDLLFIQAVGSISGGGVSYGQTTYWITLINQTDTPGNTQPASSVLYPIPELPIGKMGVYVMGRNWMCLADGQSFIASDIVGSSSGSFADGFLDAVLKVSQNQQLAGGGTFRLPGAGTQIQAMSFIPALDVSLGQGPVQILTQNTVFSCNAPPDITTWATVTNPIVTESLIGAGAVSQNSVVNENSDIFFRSPDGFIRSLVLARLDFNQWGNTPASVEVVRSLQYDNPALLPFAAGCIFSNRLLMTCKPAQQTRGVAHAALVSLNFDPLSTIEQKSPSTWESEWTLPNVVGMTTGFFNTVERCFMLTLNNNLLGLTEILPDIPATLDNGTTPVAWVFETAFVFKDPDNTKRQYKRLINGEFSVSGITGNVAYQAFYKSDQEPVWTPWYAGNIVYLGASDPGFRSRLGLGMPSPTVFDAANNRPLREGYAFQVKFMFTGDCTFISGRFAADAIDEPEFAVPR